MKPAHALCHRLISFCITIAIGLIGTFLAVAIGFPAPYLSGPVIAVALISFCGFKPYNPTALTQFAFVLVGIMMGASITPDVIAAVKTWPISFIAVLVAIYILLYAAYWVLKRGFRYDHNTAMLASSPGHLSYVLSLATSVKTDIPAVSVIQSVRLVALTLSVPIIVEYFDLIDPARVTITAPMPIAALIVTVLVALALGFLFTRWKWPAALLLGGVSVSATTHLSGLIEGGVPDWLGIPTYIYLGCMIGSRFASFTGDKFLRAFVAGFSVTIVVVAIAGAFAVAVSHYTGVPLNAVMIAFAPGGLETMSAMAIMMHADTAYVGAHHILRLFFLTILMPIVLKTGRAQNASID